MTKEEQKLFQTVITFEPETWKRLNELQNRLGLAKRKFIRIATEEKLKEMEKLLQKEAETNENFNRTD